MTTATKSHWFIDADSHISEPSDLWTSRMSKKFGDDVPHVVSDEQGRDFWVMGGRRVGSPVGVTAVAGWDDYPASYPMTLADAHPASYDAAARIRYMDEQGIWAQVLYSNVAGHGGQRLLALQNSELQLACVKTYNDFLSDWTSVAPDRLLKIMAIPFWDVEETVKEIKRCAEVGFRGILFTGEPQRFGLPVIGDRHWDPMWSAAQEAGLPIHFHIGGGEERPEGTLEREAAHGQVLNGAFQGVAMFLKNGVQCADLILSGVLARFPELKFVSVESGIGWIPFMLEAADYGYTGTNRQRHGDNELLPSELFRRQVYSTYWFERVALESLLDRIPIDHIMFETDFPHPACLYGNIKETVDAGLSGIAEDVKRKLLWENAAVLYKIKQPEAALAS